MAQTQMQNILIGRQTHGSLENTQEVKLAHDGNVALVRSTNKHIMRRDGREEVGMTTYTDIYHYEGNSWSCIQAQITPIAPGYEPPEDTIINVYLKGVCQRRV
jgi:ketosteroid isomerase-like protein